MLAAILVHRPRLRSYAFAAIFQFIVWLPDMRQFAKYVTISLAAAIFYLALYKAFLVYTTIWYIAASWIAIGFVFVFKFIAQKKWVFGHASRNRVVIFVQAIFLATKYALFSSVNSLLLYWLVEKWLFVPFTAQLIAMLCIGPFSFLASRWVFKT